MYFKDINIKKRISNDNLIREEKLEVKKNDEKNYKDLTIYFARYDHKKSKRLWRVSIIMN